jgi:sugar lactone lactonase YvrE
MLRRIVVSMATLLFLMLLVVTAFALTLTNFQAASLVLGQPNFTSGGAGLSATRMSFPQKAAVDPTTGKVFVTERNNHRVLRFAGGTALVNGAAAEAVLGQPNFTSDTAATTQNGMNTPNDVFVDAAGRLWVAEEGNHRVLRFDNAAGKANGANANGVLGQPNFTSNAAATTQSGMNTPQGVFVDAAGRLWVADAFNHRVLRFDNAAGKANGANANGVLGQPTFTSNAAATTQSGMLVPGGVFVDAAGRLWVAEFGNHRVLRFDNAAGKANGANANGVLGQSTFTGNTQATTQSGMNGPIGVAGDAAGRLWVADTFNNRVLWFDTAAAKANGGNADGVLGQPNFTSNAANNGGRSAQSLNGPHFLFYDPAGDGVLWVADHFNNRVLRYSSPIFQFLPVILKN